MRKTLLIVVGAAVALVTAVTVPVILDRAAPEDDVAEYEHPAQASPHSEQPDHANDTRPGSLGEVCELSSASDERSFIRARVSVTHESVHVVFEFDGGFRFPNGVPNSATYGRPERLVIAFDDLYTYVLFNESDDGSTIEYVVSDGPVGGERLPGTLEYVDGSLAVTLPRPSGLATPQVRWHVEAQGLACPVARDVDHQFLLTDVFAEP